MPATTRLLMTRGTFAIRAFFLSFFSFFTVILGFGLIALPQVRETLEAFDLRRPAQAGYLAFAQFYSAVAAWYCARLVLERRFLPFEVLLPCESPGFASWVVKWLPRFLGVLATVPLGVVMALVPGGSLPLWLRILPFGVAAVFLAFVVFRRQRFGDFVEYIDPPEVAYGYRRFDRLNSRGWALLAVLAAVPSVIFILLRHDPRLVARMFATPALGLFAIGSWNLATGFLLVYLPLSYHRAVWTAFPLLFAALFSVWVE